jgi:hypothetical protein
MVVQWAGLGVVDAVPEDVRLARLFRSQLWEGGCKFGSAWW